ncbi:MAG TPA: hypothetical protein VNP92_12320 [Actinophytocola sp.]|nr:hypothetical protein [Actinophytocola sp.]
MSEFSYRQRFMRGEGGQSAASINSVAREVLAELADPGSAASSAAAGAGLERTRVLDARAEITEGEHGLEPVATTILVGIAVSAGSKVAETLWTKVLWPRISRRLGVDALGEPVGETARN